MVGGGGGVPVVVGREEADRSGRSLIATRRCSSCWLVIVIVRTITSIIIEKIAFPIIIVIIFDN
jgi:hypothetical protein